MCFKNNKRKEISEIILDTEKKNQSENHEAKKNIISKIKKMNGIVLIADCTHKRKDR